jgi:hypothetical protein
MIVWILKQLEDFESWQNLGVFSSEEKLLAWVEKHHAGGGNIQDMEAFRHSIDDPDSEGEFKYVVVRDGKAFLSDQKRPRLSGQR